MRAIVRGLPRSFARATVQRPPQAPIDVDLAERQHRAYVQALVDLGVEVIELPADDTMPDGCFVEDCAVVAAGRALVTIPGSLTRRSETASIAGELARWLPTETMTPPATLDGGDCLRLGSQLLIGRSGRTNDAGVDQVRAAFAPRGGTVSAVDVPFALHLKCVCSALDPTTVLLADGTVPAGAFGDCRIISVPAEEAYAANCVVIGRTVLLAAGHPLTREKVEGAGFAVRELATSEISKADGSLTCMSILF